MPLRHNWTLNFVVLESHEAKALGLVLEILLDLKQKSIISNPWSTKKNSGARSWDRSQNLKTPQGPDDNTHRHTSSYHHLFSSPNPVINGYPWIDEDCQLKYCLAHNPRGTYGFLCNLQLWYSPYIYPQTGLKLKLWGFSFCICQLLISPFPSLTPLHSTVSFTMYNFKPNE